MARLNRYAEISRLMSSTFLLQKSVITALLLAVCLSLGSNAQQAPIAPPPAPEQSKTPPPDAAGHEKDKSPSDRKAEAGAAVDSNSYKIGPSDVLSIRVWNEEKFSGLVAVHQDGKITLPLVGDVDAGKLTPVEVQDNVAKALTKYVVKPLVTVTVQEVGSKKYYLDGQVNHPGEFALAVPTTILEAISRAGGLQEFANSKKIYVLRGDKRLPFNYKDVLRGKHMEQNIRVEPGDHIVVP
jgi:polysaccharide export outer membrane protein